MATLYYLPTYKTTTLATTGGIDDSQTSDIELTNVTGVTTTKPGIICVTYATPLDTDTYELITYTSIDGSNKLVGATRGAEGSTARSHSNLATIGFVISKAHINNINDKLTGNDTTALADPNGNEILKTSYVASAVNELTVKNAATGNSPIIQSTGEADTGLEFQNSEGEEGLIIDYNATAVNEITVDNAATGVAPSISATGGDENIDLKLIPKGTGEVKFRRSIGIQVDDHDTDITTGDGRAFFTIPEQYDGMNLSAVHARCITAPTGATITIQVHNLTDTADMLSTEITIDATETGSDTAATPAVIDTDNDDVATNDCIRIDVDQVGSTEPGEGLFVRLEFDLP